MSVSNAKVREYANARLVRGWLDARKEQIHRRVTAADVLARHGAGLQRHGDREEQISCPFHGADTNPSARYFPESGRSPSHVWCFVCQEHWDAIGLWKKFTGTSKFSTLLFEIERAFGLTPPESGMSAIKEDVDPLIDDCNALFESCERVLRNERAELEMITFLRLGSLLDRLRFDYERGAITATTAYERVMQLVQRIGEKARASKTAAP